MITETEINRTMRTLHILWIALMISLVIYLILGFVFLKDAVVQTLAPEMFSILKTVIYGFSLLAVIAAGFLRRLVLSGKIIKMKSNNPSVNPLLSRYATGVILAMALSESGGIYGLTLYIIGRDIRDLVLLVLFSAAAMLYYKPKRAELAAMILEPPGEKGIIS
jgi:hypothetical protein